MTHPDEVAHALVIVPHLHQLIHAAAHKEITLCGDRHIVQLVLRGVKHPDLRS